MLMSDLGMRRDLGTKNHPVASTKNNRSLDGLLVAENESTKNGWRFLRKPGQKDKDKMAPLP